MAHTDFAIRKTAPHLDGALELHELSLLIPYTPGGVEIPAYRLGCPPEKDAEVL